MNKDAFSDFQERIGNIQDEDLKAMMRSLEEELDVYEKGEYLLTDDKAPVELLGMQVIDGLIQNEIGYYKEIFREDGIKDCWSNFNIAGFMGRRFEHISYNTFKDEKKDTDGIQDRTDMHILVFYPYPFCEQRNYVLLFVCSSSSACGVRTVMPLISTRSVASIII